MTVTKYLKYTVTLKFQYPAYDEVQGIVYGDISGASKSGAISTARRLAERDGHIPTRGKGRYTLTAVVES